MLLTNTSCRSTTMNHEPQARPVARWPDECNPPPLPSENPGYTNNAINYSH